MISIPARQRILRLDTHQCHDLPPRAARTDPDAPQRTTGLDDVSFTTKPGG
jgi:hypothetical protein